MQVSRIAGAREILQVDYWPDLRVRGSSLVSLIDSSNSYLEETSQGLILSLGARVCGGVARNSSAGLACGSEPGENRSRTRRPPAPFRRESRGPNAACRRDAVYRRQARPIAPPAAGSQHHELPSWGRPNGSQHVARLQGQSIGAARMSVPEARSHVAGGI